MRLFCLTATVPTDQLLILELKEVTKDWELFGASLRIPPFKLETIKLDDPNGGVENWKLKMFQFWLQYQQDDPSWKDVIRALKENNYIRLAVKLSRKYLPAAASSDDEGMFVICVRRKHNNAFMVIYCTQISRLLKMMSLRYEPLLLWQRDYEIWNPPLLIC